MIEGCGSPDQRRYPSLGDTVDAKACITRTRERVGPWLHWQQDQRAGLLTLMPCTDLAHGRLIAHQHSVHELTEQLFGKVRLFAIDTDMVGEGPQDPVAIVTAFRQQGRSRRGDAHSVALQRFERCAARGEGGELLFDRTTLGQFPGFTITGLAEAQA